MSKQSLAIVGTGISGLTCAWALHTLYNITVFEARDRLGGHSHTVTTTWDNHPDVPVDTGFIVYNNVTYPNLTEMFRLLNVPVKDSNMSFAVSMNDGALEYAGDNLSTLFGQRKNLLNFKFWQLLKDLLRFYKQAPRWCRENPMSTITLGEYLEQNNYSKAFIYDHIVPMGAAIWSTPNDEMLKFPATTFIQFCDNHGLLKIVDRPQWKTVDGGSKEYIKRIIADFEDKIHLDEPVQSIQRDEKTDKVTIKTKTREAQFDKVIIAAHGDQVLSLLKDADHKEKGIFSHFSYSTNEAYLHTDQSHMPKIKRTWSSWNYMAHQEQDQQSVSVTYWMNRLQGLSTPEPLFVTLNPLEPVNPDKIIKHMTYMHPLFTKEAIAAQKDLYKVQGHRNTYYCGAYAGYGFHEDGATAALAVSELLGFQRPWPENDASPAGQNCSKKIALQGTFA